MTRYNSDARKIFEAAIESVQADELLRDLDLNTMASRSLDRYDAVRVVGMGKGSVAMASVLETRLGSRIDGGAVATAKGYVDSLPKQFRPPRSVVVEEGGHPMPDEGSIRAARRLLEIAAQAGKDDLVIVLISGGGSAVCTDFPGGITLADAKRTFQLLLEAGLDIYAMNAVRKHMSTVGGGRLAAAIYPAEAVALVISDVVGDDLSVIAGGPLAGDPSTIQDARNVLREAKLWDEVPSRVRAHFESGAGETPKPDAPVFDRVSHHIIGTNEKALRGAAEMAQRLGYHVSILRRNVTGEAREAARSLLDQTPSKKSSELGCYIAGGETSVTIRGDGKGGRNQEMALAAALHLEDLGRDTVFLSGGTDGIDGPTDAAGAIVSNETAATARAEGLNPATFLERNDSYAFFEAAGGLIRTGPTHTNVMDVQVILS